MPSAVKPIYIVVHQLHGHLIPLHHLIKKITQAKNDRLLNTSSGAKNVLCPKISYHRTQLTVSSV